MISAARTAKIYFELLHEYTLRIGVSVIIFSFFRRSDVLLYLIIGRRAKEKVTSQPIDLEALDFPKYVDKEEAFSKRVKEQEAPPTIVEEAHLDVPEESSPTKYSDWGTE